MILGWPRKEALSMPSFSDKSEARSVERTALRTN